MMFSIGDLVQYSGDNIRYYGLIGAIVDRQMPVGYAILYKVAFNIKGKVTTCDGVLGYELDRYTGKPSESNHTHIRKKYIGFTESFDYCEACNERL